MRPRPRSTILFALCALVVTANADAQVKTWQKKAKDPHWELPANWTPAGAPGPADHVVIGPGSGTILITDDTAPKMIRSIEMQFTEVLGGSTLTSTTRAAGPALGSGRDIRITTSGPMGIVIGDSCFVVAAGNTDMAGLAGADVALTCTGAGSISIGSGTHIVGGKGGGAGAAGNPGRGGDVTLDAAKIDLRTDAFVRGGAAGGAATALPAGETCRGGDVVFMGGVVAMTRCKVLGGDNGGRGGDVKISAARVVLDGNGVSPVPGEGVYLIRGGHAGSGAASRGGAVLIASSPFDIEVRGELTAILGGNGSSAVAGAGAGEGGDVVMAARGDFVSSILQKKSTISGGDAGRTGPGVAPLRGGSVLLVANGTCEVFKLTGGRGSMANNQPRGIVLAVARRPTLLQGGNVDASKVFVVARVWALPLDGDGPTIDLAGASTGAITATERILLDAGCSGTIDLLGAAHNALVCLGGPGSVELEAQEALIEADTSLAALAAPDPIVDSIGACDDTCAPDLNEDGVVDQTDLSLLLALWGTEGGPADVDGDGDVDGADLAAMLAAWGDCGEDA